MRLYYMASVLKLVIGVFMVTLFVSMVIGPGLLEGVGRTVGEIAVAGGQAVTAVPRADHPALEVPAAVQVVGVVLASLVLLLVLCGTGLWLVARAYVAGETRQRIATAEKAAAEKAHEEAQLELAQNIARLEREVYEPIEDLIARIDKELEPTCPTSAKPARSSRRWRSTKASATK